MTELANGRRRIMNKSHGYLSNMNWSPVASNGAADWKGAFAKRNATAFANALADGVVLEAAVLFKPVRRRENVTHVMEAASNIYESLEFTGQTVDGSRQYVEWKGHAGAVASLVEFSERRSPRRFRR
jgi:hypothetical protein